MPSDRILQPRQPGTVVPSLRQQPVAAAHRRVMRGHLPSMPRLQRPDQPIEKPPPPRQPLLKQPVHLRRQPHRRDQPCDIRLTARRRPVHPEHPPVRLAVRPGAYAGLTLLRPKPSIHRPAARPAKARQIGVPRPAQPAPRHQ